MLSDIKVNKFPGGTVRTFLEHVEAWWGDYFTCKTEVVAGCPKLDGLNMVHGVSSEGIRALEERGIRKHDKLVRQLKALDGTP